MLLVVDVLVKLATASMMTVSVTTAGTFPGTAVVVVLVEVVELTLDPFFSCEDHHSFSKTMLS